MMIWGTWGGSRRNGREHSCTTVGHAVRAACVASPCFAAVGRVDGESCEMLVGQTIGRRSDGVASAGRGPGRRARSLIGWPRGVAGPATLVRCLGPRTLRPGVRSPPAAPAPATLLLRWGAAAVDDSSPSPPLCPPCDSDHHVSGAARRIHLSSILFLPYLSPGALLISLLLPSIPRRVACIPVSAAYLSWSARVRFCPSYCSSRIARCISRVQESPPIASVEEFFR